MRLPGPQARSLCGACSWEVVYLVHRRSLPAPHSLFSGDKQVNVLWRAQHLCRPLNTNHGSQPLGIVLGIEHGAGPRGLLSSTGGSQHITDFTVEVRVCWQFVEYEVPDAFYCVPLVEMETFCEEQKLLLSLEEEVPSPGDPRLLCILADVCEVQLFSLEVISEAHKVKVGGDIDECVGHDSIPVLRQNLVYEKVKPD